MSIVLKGGTIISANDNKMIDIRIEGEKIVGIGMDIEIEGDEIIDCSGCYILPGGIDVHTHLALNTDLATTADDFETGTKAAIMGGTTTIIDFINHKRGTSFTESLECYRKLSANKCYCDYGFHMTISEWNDKLDKEMESIVNQGITTFKIYMAYKNILQLDEDVIEKILRKSKELGVLLSVHCEDGNMIYDNVRKLLSEGKYTPKYHEVSRNDDIELLAVKKLLDITDKVNYPIYIVHLSCKKSLYEIRGRRLKGSKIIVETCPQYLVLTKEMYKGTSDDEFDGAKYVMSPPLRNKLDNEVLWQGIRKSEIQVLATDHCSFNYKGQKEIGISDFSKIPNGAPGVEHRMQLAYSYGVANGTITLNKLVEVTAENPAKIFGLYPKKGVIRLLSDADIIIIKPNYNGKISYLNHSQNVDYTPYEGMDERMYIRNVFLRGKEIVRDRKMLHEIPFGKFQKRDKYRKVDS